MLAAIFPLIITLFLLFGCDVESVKDQTDREVERPGCGLACQGLAVPDGGSRTDMPDELDDRFYRRLQSFRTGKSSADRLSASTKLKLVSEIRALSEEQLQALESEFSHLKRARLFELADSALAAKEKVEEIQRRTLEKLRKPGAGDL